MTGTIAIVGAGQAGAMAASALRKRGFDGRLVLIGREVHRPYERPPLTKDFLCGEQEPRIDVLNESVYQEQRIELLGAVSVDALLPGDRLLRLSDGSELRFDRCLLATGGRPRPLASLPAGEGIHYLRTVDDARRLRASLRPGIRLVVVGGGFLGLELASSARRMGAEVDVLEAAGRPLERFLPPDCSDWLARRVEAAGVRLHLGASLSEVERAAERWILGTAEGQRFEADQVVVSVGLAPEIELARAAGLLIETGNGGIAVDESCRTSHPDVFAAGDCASQFRASAGQVLRLESWQNANEQAQTAAAAMLGQALPPAPYPWFWTDQFDCNIQMLGLRGADLSYVLRGDPSAQPAKALWLGHRAGVPVHLVAINAGGELRPLRPLFERAVPLDVAAFADPSVPLRAQAKAALDAHAGNAAAASVTPSVTTAATTSTPPPSSNRSNGSPS